VIVAGPVPNPETSFANKPRKKEINYVMTDEFTASSPNAWVEFELELPEELTDPVSNFFHELGCLGLIEEPGENGAKVKAFFPNELRESVTRELISYLAALGQLFPDQEITPPTITAVKSENWAVMWKDNFKTMEVGESLIVTPPWLPISHPGKHVVIIEPAEAFGTGSHETTQSCLVLLEQAIQESSDAKPSALDVGCGSGILAIAAFKLGASPVTAIDNDPVAVRAALKNAELNNVSDRILFTTQPVEELKGSYSIVAANLDFNTFKKNADRLVRLFQDRLIVSGITDKQWPEVKETAERLGLVLEREIAAEEWRSGLFRSRNQS
jgi:ribosomal protein L11 methyltransferase